MRGVYLPVDFVEKYVRFTKPEYLQVYIYTKYCMEKGEKFPSAEEISLALDILPARAEFIIEYWVSQGEYILENGTYSIKKDKNAPVVEEKPTEKEAKKSLIQRVRSMKPSYSQTEIDAVATENKKISSLFYQAEKILSKVLTASDMELLYSFNDWLGLPIEVILMLITYAAKKGKTTKRYLETVAIDWAEKGIDTFEAAEDYVSQLEAADSAEKQIRSILGIYDRGLTATEKKYIKIWAEDLKISPELISLAYDKTVEYTGKLSWSYMDKMLKNWFDSGFKTVLDVKNSDEEFHKSKSKTEKPLRTSKFNNYDDDNKDDYKELEEQILNMMLDDDY